MKRTIQRTLSIVMLAIAASLFGGCAAKVEPGWVGIKVDNYGTKRGVEDYPTRTGIVLYNPITTDVHKYPVFTQQIVWCKSPHEGKAADESISFNSKEGASVNADVCLAYSLDPLKVPGIFVEFKQDITALTEGYMRSKVRDAFSRIASVMPVTEIYGVGKQKLLTTVREDLNASLGPKGFKFDMISFTNDLRLDPKVQEAINATISATQRAIEAENKVREATALAAQKEATAKGDAAAAVSKAKGEAEANRLVAESLSANPNLVEWRRLQIQSDAIRQWDGHMPQVTGGSVPMIQLPAPAAPAK